jgi:hypothetical protein
MDEEVFLFLKKKQESSASGSLPRGAQVNPSALLDNQRFFGSFLKKGTASLILP